jgi:hypothetical protein
VTVVSADAVMLMSSIPEDLEDLGGLLGHAEAVAANSDDVTGLGHLSSSSRVRDTSPNRGQCSIRGGTEAERGFSLTRGAIRALEIVAL